MTATATPRKVLVVGPAWVGDMVMAQSLFKTLKRQDPQVEIDVVAPGWSEPLLARMPEVDRTHPLAVSHGKLNLSERWGLGRRLRQQHYDQAIVLPRSAKSALVPWLAGIPRRTGYRGEHRYGLLNDRRELNRLEHFRTVDRFIALANDGHTQAVNPPQPELTSSRDQQAAAMHALELAPGAEPILALCPGAEYGPAKRWPSEYFAALARQYLSEGWQVWLLGSHKDAALTALIGKQAPGVVDLAGRTSLDQAIDLLAISTVVVSNDSGLMHVAAGAGTAVVALYGSSDPQYTPPLSDRAQVVYHGLDCSPCFSRECPLGHLNCLVGITPDQVSDAVDNATGVGLQPEPLQ